MTSPTPPNSRLSQKPVCMCAYVPLMALMQHDRDEWTWTSNKGSREQRVEGVICIRNGEHVGEEREKAEKGETPGERGEVDTIKKMRDEWEEGRQVFDWTHSKE
ncbi:hypothetical protein AMECASPLE_008850 [Ameca splendens]|uniref:Uncharacterized protein n=1 Tax=Ameca splendens TaxID=208324 RepID=A0ABV0YM47_9TELE